MWSTLTDPRARQEHRYRWKTLVWLVVAAVASGHQTGAAIGQRRRLTHRLLDARQRTWPGARQALRRERWARVVATDMSAVANAS